LLLVFIPPDMDRRIKMGIRIGQLVTVNVAAFIGSPSINPTRVPCRVMDVGPAQLFVRTMLPYRVFNMWVSREWIEEAIGPADCRLLSSN